MFVSADRRRYLLPALLATLLFWILTVGTRYPFVVDDYMFLWRSKLPGFGIRDFGYLLPERPLATLLNYFTFGLGILEHTKLPFLLYYFTHSLGVLLIFYRVARFFFPKEDLSRDRAVLLIGALICLYPDWFEITLLPLDFPYGLGVLFLGLALWAESALARAALYLLSFCCLEAYVFPALALTALELPKRRTRERALSLFGPIFAASVGYLAVSRGLSKELNIPPHYVMGFSVPNALHMSRMYLKMIAFHSFYKVNWVATALDLITMVAVAVAVIRKDGSWIWKTAILFLLPCLGAAHMLIVVDYYAPRAIHGALVLRAVSSGILLVAYLKLNRRSSPLLRWAPAALVLIAFVSHHGLILFYRSYNERILTAKQVEIESTLRTCKEPCHISLQGIEDQLYWDWIMRPTFHAPFVLWIKERINLHKEVTAD